MKALLLILADGSMRIYNNCASIAQAKKAGLKTDHYSYEKHDSLQAAKDSAAKHDEYRTPTVTTL